MNASLLEDVQWPACLSAYRLDRFRLQALPPEESAEVTAHLTGCARCQAASEALAAAEAEFRASAPPRRKAPHRRPRPLGIGLGVLAAAAAVVLALWPPTGTRSKGSPVSLGMYVQHAQAVRRALPGETVAPGDSVRFTYSSHTPTTLAVLSVDGQGRASVYFPVGPETAPVPAAEDAPLPLATQLDAVLGEEKVVALFCERPQALEPLRAALAASAGSLDVPGCRVAGFHFTKRAP